MIANKIKYSDLESAFQFVAGSSDLLNQAFLCLDTGEIFFSSDLDPDAFDELPEDLDSDRYIEIPHKSELGLGKPLALAFAADCISTEFETVARMFRKREAYSRFKNFLAAKGLLNDWYAFEESRTERSLREWCTDNNIILAD